MGVFEIVDYQEQGGFNPTHHRAELPGPEVIIFEKLEFICVHRVNSLFPTSAESRAINMRKLALYQNYKLDTRRARNQPRPVFTFFQPK